MVLISILLCREKLKSKSSSSLWWLECMDVVWIESANDSEISIPSIVLFSPSKTKEIFNEV